LNLSEKSGTSSQPVVFHYTAEFLHEIAGHVFAARCVTVSSNPMSDTVIPWPPRPTLTATSRRDERAVRSSCSP